jgi:hypothetical protein
MLVKKLKRKLSTWIVKLAVSTLSVKAKDEAEQRDAIKALSSNAAADTQPKTIGDLIKEQQQNQ